jgi:N-formylglutamate amidohydrolase
VVGRARERLHSVMDDLFDPELEPPFEIVQPKALTAPVVFNSPHSGAVYPARFLAQSCLDPLTLRRSEDAFVDDLFSAAPAAGAPLMRALFPRALVDVNREPYELDPKMFEARLPLAVNSRSPRVAAGLGTIPRIVADSQVIYTRPLPVAEALFRIEQLYRPYHAALRQLLKRVQQEFGFAVLVDCHSMPSGQLSRSASPRADIVLGDRYGSSCDPALTAFTEAALVRMGYRVARNRPYAGGYITEHYGRPAQGVHALQIEVNRALYMDERLHCLNEGFERLKADMTVLVGLLIGFAHNDLGLSRFAAE